MPRWRIKSEYNTHVMRYCLVSMTGKMIGCTPIEVDAESLFAAAHAGIHEWCRLWWYSGEALIEVRFGQQCWHVKAERISAWYSERFRHGTITKGRFETD